jgi:hypothetical protein
MTGAGPGAALRLAWPASCAAFGGAAGLLGAWAAGAAWAVGAVGRQGAGGPAPPDLLAAMGRFAVPGLALVAAGAGLGLVLARRGRDVDPGRRWLARRWLLAGAAAGVLAGLPPGLLLVAGWSAATLDLGGGPPSVERQLADVMVLGLVLAIPLACAALGAGGGRLLAGRGRRTG